MGSIVPTNTLISLLYRGSTNCSIFFGSLPALSGVLRLIECALPIAKSLNKERLCTICHVDKLLFKSSSTSQTLVSHGIIERSSARLETKTYTIAPQTAGYNIPAMAGAPKQKTIYAKNQTRNSTSHLFHCRPRAVPKMHCNMYL